MLHVTNGDLAAERIAAAVPGEVLPWRDVLHEGPVPGDLDDAALRKRRAEFLAGEGAGPSAVLRSLEARDARLARARDDEEVVLWFEPDLYDQLQLLQVLDRLSRTDLEGVTLTAVDMVPELGTLGAVEVRALHAARAPLPPLARDLGRRAWALVREVDPRGLEAFASRPLPELPHLPAAVARFLEELPWVGDGLSRSERQALEALAAGPLPAARAFVAAHHAREDPVFLGDLVFYGILDRLAEGELPLVRIDPAPAGAASRVAIAETGRDVLAGRAEWSGRDRWLGGVRLRGGKSTWRWNPAARRVTRSPGSPRDPGSAR